MTLVKIKPTMTPAEMVAFRNHYNLTTKGLAALVGVTVQAVLLWESGDRRVPETTVRLLIMFVKYPHLIKEF